MAAPTTYLSDFYDGWGDDLVAITGRLFIAYGQLEHILKFAYKRITITRYGDAMDIVRDLSKPELTTLIKHAFAVPFMNQGLEGQLDEMIERILEVNWYLNFLVHGYWHRKIETGELRITSHDKQIIVDADLVENLKIMHAEIVSLRDTLNKFSRDPTAA